MFFQMILKGIAKDDDEWARRTLFEHGISCRWWNRVGLISPEQIKERLTERNLMWHLSRYNHLDPTFNNEPFCDHTPFISTTAGAVERIAMLRRNRVFSPFMTSLAFATADFTRVGYVFHGYVFTLGKKTVELREFAEEVRDVYVYSQYLPFYREGEIVAKVNIAAVNLEKYEKFDPMACRTDLAAGRKPQPIDVVVNPDYAPPQRFANIRGTVV